MVNDVMNSVCGRLCCLCVHYAVIQKINPNISQCFDGGEVVEVVTDNTEVKMIVSQR